MSTLLNWLDEWGLHIHWHYRVIDVAYVGTLIHECRCGHRVAKEQPQ